MTGSPRIQSGIVLYDGGWGGAIGQVIDVRRVCDTLDELEKLAGNTA